VQAELALLFALGKLWVGSVREIVPGMVPSQKLQKAGSPPSSSQSVEPSPDHSIAGRLLTRGKALPAQPPHGRTPGTGKAILPSITF
jgi:hypothetical protein